MSGIGPNQFSSAGYAVTANNTVSTAVADLLASTIGKINFININFTGHAAISAGNSMFVALLDAGLTNQYMSARVNRGNAAALDIPGTNLISLSNLNLPFSNGLSIQVISTNAGDVGVFSVQIGYDRTI